MNGINVLSLFDGMSCGQIALQKAGIKVNKYFAAEIDKHAIQVTQHNFPNTIQLGDVTKVFAKDLPKIDLLIGGSPCQGFSFAGKQLAFDDPRSKLFFEFVRLKNECNPTYFMLENVKMKKEFELIISKYMGVAPIEINSALLSAQNRVRLYWTNIANEPFGLFGDMQCMIPQPKDKGILLRDILETDVPDKYYLSDKMLAYFKNRAANFNQGKVNVREENGKASCLTSSMASCDISDNFIETIMDFIKTDRDKSICLDANYYKGIGEVNGTWRTTVSNQKQSLIQIGNIYNNDHNSVAGRVYTDKGKSVTLSALGGGGGAKTGLYQTNKQIRRLTPNECERLQTVPDGYTSCVSDTQRYRMLGNGWTVDVIAYIFSYLDFKIPK